MTSLTTGLPNAKFSERVDGFIVDYGFYTSKEFLLAVSLASKPGTVHVIIITTSKHYRYCTCNYYYYW